MFNYIHQQMVRQSQKNVGSQKSEKRAMNRAMLAAMERGEIFLAGVRCDGSREMQQQPQAITDSTFIVWPTFVFQFEDSPMYGSYCVGLALQDGAAAWPAHRDSLEIYGKFGIDQIQYPISINVQTMPSMVIIEEITETEEKQQMPVQTTSVDLEKMD